MMTAMAEIADRAVGFMAYNGPHQRRRAGHAAQIPRY
jgi:hypothetical protein